MANIGQAELEKRKGAPIQHLIAKWKKQSRQGDAPIFQLLTRAIVSDIRSGEVASGSKLPTHRNLAVQLGITVGTASRAYSEIRRVGLIEAGVGRGTYVRGQKAANNESTAANRIDLRFHGVRTAAYANEMARTLIESGPELSEHRTMGRTDYTISEAWSQAGAKWLNQSCNCDVKPSEIVVIGGIQQGLVSALLTFTRPNAMVVTEKRTYGGVKAAAAALDHRLIRGLAPNSSFLKMVACFFGGRRRG
jgi:DNA-binding transcriptional MocR family regulator